MKSKKQTTDGTKTIATNKKAFHNYFIVKTLEVGIALVGSELRPCRDGKVNLKDAYAEEKKGELWLYDMHIGSNPFSNRLDHEPTRKRRLLAHKDEAIKLGHKVRTTGMTMVPIRAYFKKGKVKIELALVKGKANYDKRVTLAKKDLKRDMDRELSGKY